MLPPVPPSSPPFHSTFNDLATATDRDELAWRLAGLVDYCLALGRWHGDDDATIRLKLLVALRVAIETPIAHPSPRRLRRVRRAGWLFAAFRGELKRAGITPSDEFGRETFASITRRAIDRETLGSHRAGPGVWAAEDEHR